MCVLYLIFSVGRNGLGDWSRKKFERIVRGSNALFHRTVRKCRISPALCFKVHLFHIHSKYCWGWEWKLDVLKGRNDKKLGETTLGEEWWWWKHWHWHFKITLQSDRSVLRNTGKGQREVSTCTSHYLECN